MALNPSPASDWLCDHTEVALSQFPNLANRPGVGLSEWTEVDMAAEQCASQEVEAWSRRLKTALNPEENNIHA